MIVPYERENKSWIKRYLEKHHLSDTCWDSAKHHAAEHFHEDIIFLEMIKDAVHKNKVIDKVGTSHELATDGQLKIKANSLDFDFKQDMVVEAPPQPA